MATGCLSAPNIPAIDGKETFSGPIYHTARWPHEGLDLSGKRVAVIGTGSSGVQAIPVIARQAEHLTVFQRSPQWSIPARNQPVDPDAVAEVKADYTGFRARSRLQPGGDIASMPVNDFSAMSVDEQERQRIFDERWQLGGLSFYSSFNDIKLNQESNTAAAEFVRARIRAIVKDPARSPRCYAPATPLAVNAA